MVPRCRWPEGCQTILRDSNKTGLCGAHERALLEEKRKREENFSRRKEVGESEYIKQALSEYASVKQVLAAVCPFYGASCKRTSEEVTFARQVVIYLLKNDFQMTYEVMSLHLKHDFKVVKHSYQKIAGLVNTSTELKGNLEKIRAQYRGPA